MFPGDVDAASCSFRIHNHNNEPYIHVEVVKMTSPGWSTLNGSVCVVRRPKTPAVVCGSVAIASVVSRLVHKVAA